VELFSYILEQLKPEVVKEIELFLEEDGKEQRLEKMFYIINELPQLQPQAIRKLATHLSEWLGVEESKETYPAYLNLTKYANELEKQVN
jgi:hypothetical protein